MPKGDFPKWFYGPDNPEGRIFQKDDQIPSGWVDHPSKLGDKPEEPKKGSNKKNKPDVEPSAEEKASTIASLREAGVEIADDASVDEINAAIDKLTATP